ncbi:MAG: hypothetical protein AB7L66_15075 [Gemmatimonadales bacterium]
MASLLAGPAVAQASSPGPELGGLCFRGRPAPACRAFWITDASYAIRVIPGNRAPSLSISGSRYLGTVAVGRMWNVAGPFALGGAVGLAAGDGLSLEVAPRLRTWVGSDLAVDVSPVIGFGEPHASGEASIMFRDQFGLFTRVDETTERQYDPILGVVTSRPRTRAYVGFRFGSEPGLVGIIGDGLFLVVALVGVMIACGGGGCFD